MPLLLISAVSALGGWLGYSGSKTVDSSYEKIKDYAFYGFVILGLGYFLYRKFK